MAAFKASARSLDQGVGAVLDALDEHELADTRSSILTTDHGLAVPGRQGDAHRPRDRRHARSCAARAASTAASVSDALVSQVDLFPTICELAGHRAPGLAARPLAAAARAPRGRAGQRRGVCGDHLPRRLRAAARGAHPALQVHPPLRRPPRARCSRTSTTAPQGPAARAPAGPTARAARGALRPRSSTRASAQPRRRCPRTPTSSAEPARAPGGLDARDRRPAARRPGPPAAGREVNDPASVVATEPFQRPWTEPRWSRPGRHRDRGPP